MKKQCIAQSMTETQCQRSAKFGDYCFQHRPEWKNPNGKRRSKADNTNYLFQARRAILLEDSLVAVKKIAKGHANPMLLCQNVLSRFVKDGSK